MMLMDAVFGQEETATQMMSLPGELNWRNPFRSITKTPVDEMRSGSHPRLWMLLG
jgi:hypothetical protein